MSPQEIADYTGLPIRAIEYASLVLRLDLNHAVTSNDLGRMADLLAKNGGYSHHALNVLRSIRGGINYTELLTLSLVDRIAQFIMAVLYSASHIELTALVGEMRLDNVSDERRRKSEKRQREDKIKQIKERLSDAKAAYSGPTVYEISIDTGIAESDIHEAASVLLIKENGISQPNMRRICSYLKAQRNLSLAELGALERMIESQANRPKILMRGSPQNAEDGNAPITEVSEIDFDTTAVAIVAFEERSDLTILVACNFKRREMRDNVSFKAGPEHASFKYIDFGNFTESTIQLLKSGLVSELADIKVNGDGDAQYLAQSIKRCMIIGRDPKPTNAEENAEAHAEMQILQKCRVLDRISPNFYLGVSRACCPRCADELDRSQVKYKSRHSRQPKTSWKDPAEFSTKVIETFEL